jgi:hypothetical protein
MPLECTYFFLLLKNGVPAGYGCGSTLADRSEVAANVFSSFRRGESAFIYGQVLRTVHHAFGSDSFLIDKYQIGYDNSEGIKSGAFWFYHKMGFRPVDSDVRQLAAGEVKKMAERRGYRSPPDVLRELAESDMLLSLTGRTPVAESMRLGNLGRVVTGFIGREFGGNRDAAIGAAMRRLRKALPLAPLSRFSTDEAQAIKRFSPLVVQIPDLGSWGRRDRAALVKLMAAKGSQSEIPYARQLAKHDRFLESLVALSRQGGEL